MLVSGAAGQCQVVGLSLHSDYAAGMELRQLRYFVAVAEEGNISRAAQKIFLTQPALSRQIKALENEIGQCLLKREAHSIRLTPAGEMLLREAREFLQRADEMLERVRAASQSVRLRVGYAPSLASGLLSAAVESFVQKHPNARVELFDLSTKELLAGLENDTLDAVLTVGLDRDAHGFKWTQLICASWRLAVNRHHPLARKARVTPAEVALGPLLVFCQRDYPEYWNIVTGWMGENHFAALPTSLYGVVLLMAAFAYLILQRAIIACEGRGSSLAGAIGSDWKGKLSILCYFAAIGLAFVNQWLSDALYVFVAVMWLIPDRRVERALANREG